MTKFERLDTTENFQARLDDLQKAYYKANPHETVWVNDKYIVHKRIDVPSHNDKGILFTHLSIRTLTNSTIRDWREMQYIKNELVGEENEGFEIFPKEARLVDTANQFHLWVFQDTANQLPIGWNERIVTDLMNHPSHKGKLKHGNKAKQRSFDNDRKPHDNYVNFKIMVNELSNFVKDA